MRIRSKIMNFNPWIFYLLVVTLILGSLVGPGYVFSLDMVFGPQVNLPEITQSSFLFYGILKVFSFVMPVWLLQKAILIGIILLAGIGMHRLLLKLEKNLSISSIYVGSLFYVVNPFTYSRFMAGQFAVLLGYSLLPWFIVCLLKFGQKPEYRQAIKLSLLLSCIAIISLHTLATVAIISLTLVSVYIHTNRNRLGNLYQKYRSPAVVCAIIFLLLNGIWLIPLLTGHSSTAQQIHEFNTTDIQAFATIGAGPIDRLIHILHLQGFWAEARGLYLLPQNIVPMWGLLSAVLLLVVLYGAREWWGMHKKQTLSFWVAAFVAVFIASGLLNPLLDLPLLHGLREPHKLVSLVALAYSISLTFAVHTLIASKKILLRSVIPGLAILLILIFTYPMLWGFNSQLTTSDYPAEWYDVSKRLSADDDDYNMLFLPWHHYMSYNFTERIIAHPAPHVFSKPILISQDPEFSNLPADKQSRDIAKLLVEGKNMSDFAQQLGRYNIKYILVAHELDYRTYDYLKRDPAIRIISEGSTISVYQNKAWRR